MACSIASQTRCDGCTLDFAEHRSWQNYLATVLRMTATLDRRLASGHELSLLDVDLLTLLDESPTGRVQMGDLAKSLPGLPNRPTRQIRRLEDQGLVQRSVDPTDRRRVMLAITPKGRTAVGNAMITYADSVRDHFLGPLTRPQVSAIAEACAQINDPLKRS